MEQLRQMFEESILVKKRLIEAKLPAIAQATAKIENTLRAGRRVLLCGNGGSASDAQHIAAELLGRFLFNRPALPVIALSTNLSALTAIANDFSYEDIFAREVEGLGAKGDILWALSTSGNSKNVLNAVNKAKEMGLYTIGMTGENGGKMREIVDLLIDVPSKSTPRIQEAHITIGHAICEIVEFNIFRNNR